LKDALALLLQIAAVADEELAHGLQDGVQSIKDATEPVGVLSVELVAGWVGDGKLEEKLYDTVL